MMMKTKTNWIYGDNFSSFVVRVLFYKRNGELIAEQKTIFSFN